MSSSSTKTHINKTKQTHPPQTESINISIITAISHVVLSKISSTPSTHQRNQRVFSRFLRVYLVFSHGFLMCFIPFWLGVSFHISIFSIFPMVFPILPSSPSAGFLRKVAIISWGRYVPWPVVQNLLAAGTQVKPQLEEREAQLEDGGDGCAMATIIAISYNIFIYMFYIYIYLYIYISIECILWLLVCIYIIYIYI